MTTFLNQVEEKWWQSDINTVMYDENTEQNRLSKALILIFDFESLVNLKEANDLIDSCDMPEKHIVSAWLALRFFIPYPVFQDTFNDVLGIINDDDNAFNPLYHINHAKKAGLTIPEGLDTVWSNFRDSVYHAKDEYNDNRFGYFFKKTCNREEAWNTMKKYELSETLSCFSYDMDWKGAKSHRVGVLNSAFKYLKQAGYDANFYEVAKTREEDVGYADCRCAVDVDNKDVIQKWYPTLNEDEPPPEEDRETISHWIARELRNQFHKVTGEKITPLSFIEMQADYNNKGEYKKFSRHFVLPFTKYVGKGASSWKAIAQNKLFDASVFGATCYRMLGQSKRKRNKEDQRKLTIVTPDDMRDCTLDDELSFYYLTISTRERSSFYKQTVYVAPIIPGKRRRVHVSSNKTPKHQRANIKLKKAFEKGKEMGLFVKGSVTNGYTGDSLRITRPFMSVCPFGIEDHKSNCNSTITPPDAPFQYVVRCFGGKCRGKTCQIDLTPVNPAADKAWLKEKATLIAPLIKKRLLSNTKKKDENDKKKDENDKKKEKPYVLLAKPNGYMLTNGEQVIHIGLERCRYGQKEFNTPSTIRFALYNHSFTPKAFHECLPIWY